MTEWTPAHSTGEPRMDAEHRELFRRAGALAEELRGGDRDAARNVLDGFEAYARSHFEEEQAYLQEISHPARAVHRASYERFLCELSELRRPFESDGQSSTLAIKAQAWLVYRLEQHAARTADIACCEKRVGNPQGAPRAEGRAAAPPPPAAPDQQGTAASDAALAASQPEPDMPAAVVAAPPNDPAMALPAVPPPGSDPPPPHDPLRAAATRPETWRAPHWRRLAAIALTSVFLAAAGAATVAAVPRWRYGWTWATDSARKLAVSVRSRLSTAPDESGAATLREPAGDSKGKVSTKALARPPRDRAAAGKLSRPATPAPPTDAGAGAQVVADVSSAALPAAAVRGRAFGPARWGAGVDDVLAAFDGQATLARGKDEDGQPQAVIPQATFGSRHGSVRFYFEGDGRLGKIEIHLVDGSDRASAFDELAAWLKGQHGEPSTRRVERFPSGSWTRQATWRTPEAEIELDACDGPARILYLDMKRGEISRRDECAVIAVLRPGAGGSAPAPGREQPR